jgi:hypothetical protein
VLRRIDIGGCDQQSRCYGQIGPPYGHMSHERTSKAMRDKHCARPRFHGTDQSFKPAEKIRPIPIVLLHAPRLRQCAFQMRLPVVWPGSAKAWYNENRNRHSNPRTLEPLPARIKAEMSEHLVP